MKFDVRRASGLRGALRAPSDKSLTHRAFMLGAIANEGSVVHKPLMGEDCVSTLRCLAQMGLRYEIGPEHVRLEPSDEWTSPGVPLDCGNSGTTMRLLSGLIASRPLEATLIGDASLSKRPMGRIADPLRLMGAKVQGDTPPLEITGGDLVGIRYSTPVASAQIKSCVLLAGLRAKGETWVKEPAKSRDHTERMLSALGVDVLRDHAQPLAVGVKGGSRVSGFEFNVPADISSAAFFMVAAVLLPDSQLMLQGVSVNPSRTGILDVLQMAGANVCLEDSTSTLGEPVADIQVQSEPGLRAFHIGGDLVPRLVDEIPVLAVLATQCEGTSTIRDASELRVKESDRIELVASSLCAMGAKIETFEDGMHIHGPAKLRGAHIEACGDHRIAMAFAVAGLVADGVTTISGAESIETSFPGFEDELRRLCLD